ncbi:MAG: FAD:protein FMN transferase [Gemmataceae bacterium]|nr:FAD:protein FMN transferase [Gemmataceae bacterium]
MGRRLLGGLAVVFLGLALVTIGVRAQPTDQKRFTFQERHMGTVFRIVLYAPDEAAAKKASQAAFARVAELNRIFSDYLPESELLRLCEQAGGDPVKVSADLFAVLQKADEIAKLSDGAFDVSVAPVIRLWRTARKTKQLPDMETLKQALARVDYRKIRLDPERRTVQLLMMAMLLDLGGIAKGYTADAVLDVLRRHGVTSALVAAGGDITVSDPPPEAQGWKVGIAPVVAPGKGGKSAPMTYLLLKNAAVSTSGDANQFVEIGGVRYSHVIDPQTGLGLVGRRSVTVIAPKGVWADGLDTAACVLGPDKGLKLIESQKDCAAVFVYETPDGIVSTPSSRFAKYLWIE